MYAITFDLDTETLAKTYHTPSFQNAYNDIRTALREHGFGWQQGSVYFGDESVDPVTCVIAVMDITNKFSWFASCVRDIRMLRIEDNNDLVPAIKKALSLSNK
jgi:virulence-associated protein VapD